MGRWTVWGQEGEGEAVGSDKAPVKYIGRFFWKYFFQINSDFDHVMRIANETL